MITTSAKTLDESTTWSAVQVTEPRHIKTSAEIVNHLKQLSAPQLQQTLQISAALATQNQIRYQNWSIIHTPTNSKPAILAYKGDVYKQFEAASFTKQQQLYAQQHVRISSGLYGLIRPYDLIQPYRLEMRSKLTYTQGLAMNQFWQDKATHDLNQDIKKLNADCVINLASKEYAQVIQTNQLVVPMITIEFQEQEDGLLKTIPLYSKQARGMMVGYAIEHQVKNIDGLKKFETAGYGFVEATKERLLFVRKHKFKRN